MSLSSYARNLKIARTDFLGTTPRIIFGCESVSKIGEEVKYLRGNNVLVVTDKALRDIGLLDKVSEPLKKDSIKVTVFDDVISEPTIERVEQVVDFCKKGKFDLVIGFGGGACMDTAKVTAMLMTNPGTVSSYLARLPKPFEDKVKKKGAPLILVPTTAGTGSENTAGSVIIEGKYKTWIASPHLYPDVSIVDPLLTLTLPPRQTAGCAMDALSHAVEGFMVSALANPWSDAFALKSTELISQNLRRAYHYGEDVEARWNMSWAACIAGWVANYTWGPATLGHCVSEGLGSAYKIPHGLICGIMLPYAMKFNVPAIPQRLGQIAVTLNSDLATLPDRDAAEMSVESVVQLMKDVDLPTSLKDVHVPKVDLERFAEYLVNERQYLYDFPSLHPRQLTIDNAKQFLLDAWDGNWLN